MFCSESLVESPAPNARMVSPVGTMNRRPGSNLSGTCACRGVEITVKRGLLSTALLLLLAPPLARERLLDEQHHPNDECDFAGLKILIMSDHNIPAMKTVAPEYPRALADGGVGGVVNVKAIIDREGNVVRACAASGDPVLRKSAVTAAEQWKFVRDFGLDTKVFRKIEYLQQWITFNFRLD